MPMAGRSMGISGEPHRLAALRVDRRSGRGGSRQGICQSRLPAPPAMAAPLALACEPGVDCLATKPVIPSWRSSLHSPATAVWPWTTVGGPWPVGGSRRTASTFLGPWCSETATPRDSPSRQRAVTSRFHWAWPLAGRRKHKPRSEGLHASAGCIARPCPGSSPHARRLHTRPMGLAKDSGPAGAAREHKTGDGGGGLFLGLATRSAAGRCRGAVGRD